MAGYLAGGGAALLMEVVAEAALALMPAPLVVNLSAVSSSVSPVHCTSAAKNFFLPGQGSDPNKAVSAGNAHLGVPMQARATISYAFGALHAPFLSPVAHEPCGVPNSANVTLLMRLPVGQPPR